VVGGGVGEGLDVEFAEGGIELDDLAADVRDGEYGGEVKLGGRSANGEGLRCDRRCDGGDGGLGEQAGGTNGQQGKKEENAFHGNADT
jgi:hypothetical protein